MYSLLEHSIFACLWHELQLESQNPSHSVRSSLIVILQPRKNCLEHRSLVGTSPAPFAARVPVPSSSVPTPTSAHVPTFHLILGPIPFSVSENAPLLTLCLSLLSFINHKTSASLFLKSLSLTSLPSSLHFPSYSSSAVFPPFLPFGAKLHTRNFS